MGNIIENWRIEILIILHQLDEAREELNKSLKRRKEIFIAENDTQYKEIETIKLFSNGDSNEFDATIVGLMKKIESKLRKLEISS